MNEMLTHAPRYLFLLAMVPLALFVAYYATLSYWKATDVGRMIMRVYTLLLAIVGISFVRVLFPTFANEGTSSLIFNSVRTVFYLAMNIVLWNQFLILRGIQRKHPESLKKHNLSVRLRPQSTRTTEKADRR
jgi:hypothetical protein